MKSTKIINNILPEKIHFSQLDRGSCFLWYDEVYLKISDTECFRFRFNDIEEVESDIDVREVRITLNVESFTEWRNKANKGYKNVVINNLIPDKCNFDEMDIGAYFLWFNHLCIKISDTLSFSVEHNLIVYEKMSDIREVNVNITIESFIL